mgnify:CR=1 FL=1
MCHRVVFDSRQRRYSLWAEAVQDDHALKQVTQSPTDPGFVQNPYPFYRDIRALGDFVFWEDFGLPMATTAAAVNAVMRHPKLGRQVPEDQRAEVPENLKPFYDIEVHSLLELEPPSHTRIRKLLLRAFTGSRVRAMAPVIRSIVDELISDFPDTEFDLLDAFARPLPVRVISRLLGVPDDVGPQLLSWSNAMVAMYQARRNAEIEASAVAASVGFSEFVQSIIYERRKALGTDLISDLIRAEVDGQRMSRDEVVSTTILLLNAGHEATVHSLGNSVRMLVDFSNRNESLKDRCIEGAVEECLRFDPPLHMFRRWVYEDVSILGHDFAAGDEIGCLLGSACRDNAVWKDGDSFDPLRPKQTNVAFGAGIHFCIGAPLARLEMQIALPALLQRCPKLKIAETPKVANLYHFRGLEKLMVTV